MLPGRPGADLTDAAQTDQHLQPILLSYRISLIGDSRVVNDEMATCKLWRPITSGRRKGISYTNPNS
jgi:hypothetical protein